MREIKAESTNCLILRQACEKGQIAFWSLDLPPQVKVGGYFGRLDCTANLDS